MKDKQKNKDLGIDFKEVMRMADEGKTIADLRKIDRILRNGK